MTDIPQPLVKTDPQEARAFVLSSVALSTAVFGIAFWYGVFGTIFFEHLFNVWLASTVALVASLFVPPEPDLPRLIPWRGRFFLALPSVWLIWVAVAGPGGGDAGPQDGFAWFLAIVVVLVTLPYLLYVMILVVVPDIDQLRDARLKLAIVAITAGAAVAGFAIGTHHPRFLTCYDFKVSGSDVPENCTADRGDRP